MSGIENYFTTAGTAKRNRSQSSPEQLQNFKKMPKTEDQSNLTAIVKRLTEMDKKLGDLATKDDIQLVLSDISGLRDENRELKEKLSSLERQNCEMRAKLNELEDRNRRNNLVFRGLKKTNERDWAEVIKNFCVKLLGARNDIWINRAHPLGRMKENALIIAHFPDDRDISYILKNSKKLKGSNYVIYRDFSLDTRRVRSKLFAIRKEIKKISVTTNVFVVQAKLVVEGKLFELEKGELRSGTENGFAALGRLLGRELADLEGIMEVCKSEGSMN